MAWIYYILAIIVIILIAIAAYLYRGYSKVKPQPLPGIYFPKLTHPILGHPEYVLHPCKHVVRLETCDVLKDISLHQVLMMKHSSIFVNDASLALDLLVNDKSLETKGTIYNTFRFDPAIPDVIASDNVEYERLKSVFENVWGNEEINVRKSDNWMEELKSTINESALSNSSHFDFKNFIFKFVLKVICSNFFDFVVDDQVLQRTVDSLYTIGNAQLSTGIYVLPDIVKVKPDDLTAAKECWKSFLYVLLRHVNAYSSSTSVNTLASALKNSSLSDSEKISNIHQIVKHGLENIASTLCWLVVVLYRNPKVRAKLEVACQNYSEIDNDSYVDMFIKELLRRYPASGNMTVRTVSKDKIISVDNKDISLPENTVVHFHIWSLQNTSRVWIDAKDFIPERWMHGDVKRCPFAREKDDIYSGGGFTNNSLSYCPFSVGRICSGKTFALSIIKSFILTVVPEFRFDSSFQLSEDDIGISINAVIFPRLSKSTAVTISKVGDSIGKVVAIKPRDEGWADDDLDDDDDNLSETKKTM